MSKSLSVKEPEWLVFLRVILLGAVLAEIFRIAMLSSKNWGQQLANNYQYWAIAVLAPLIGSSIIYYAYKRDAHRHAIRIASSRRIDLGMLLLVGIWVDYLLTPQLATFHNAVSKLDNGWSPATLTVLFIILMSPLFRQFVRGNKEDLTQLYFVPDTEISGAEHDALSVTKQATDFADTVITSGARSGMVFGLDGPWGVGKTSFLNIAAKRWAETVPDSAIVFKFEPLRYASEPDLSERFIKDLCAKIRQEVFAPEFLPTATRYSRMLKGKTDVSILGVKLTLEPSNETIDDLLGDIDNLLEQINRQLIIIIDDLDRLEPKLVNNVLFTVRRTFKLSQATYILCYDTELLVAGKEEGCRARDFLEKFITAKLSLFVDLQAIKAFLNTDWHADATRFQTMPQEVMLKLRQITSEVGSLLSGPKAHYYIPLLGDLRKVKRFINALLLMNLEKTDLGRSDFHHADLIHLVLLHLCYPGLFRQIYAEETEGRTGSFSARRNFESGTTKLENAPDLQKVLDNADSPSQFLLKQLFDIDTIKFPSYIDGDEEVWRTRACFNFESRNLEQYLQLIVRFKVPEETTTFKMYKTLLEEILEGKATVKEILGRQEFTTLTSADIHDRFWRIVVNNAHRLGRKEAEDAISTLMEYIPRHSAVDDGDRSLRKRLIYSLVLLLDRAGFGDPDNGRGRSQTVVVEIAYQILEGRQPHSPPSLIQQLTSPTRGVLGWQDLMLFRLTCCADRRGQVFNIYSALLQYEDPNASATGNVSEIAHNSMRRFSQQVFQEFKKRYITPRLNFFIDVDKVEDQELLGEFQSAATGNTDNDYRLAATRSSIKTFVIYQLVNQKRHDGTGIGCGVYDEEGTSDCGGIHHAMCEYLFGFCFNPEHGLDHARAFGDYCLRALRNLMFDHEGKPNAYEIGAAIAEPLGLDEMKKFWTSFGEQIKPKLLDEKRTVVCYQLTLTYADHIKLIFDALDQLVTPSPEFDWSKPEPTLYLNH